MKGKITVFEANLNHATSNKTNRFTDSLTEFTEHYTRQLISSWEWDSLRVQKLSIQILNWTIRVPAQ